MEKCMVTILPENKKVYVDEGTTLFAAALEAGISIESPCGGQGTCGKCAVKLISGSTEALDDKYLPREFKEKGYFLACHTTVNGDVVLEIPGFSRLAKHKVMLSGKRTKYSKENDYFSFNKMNPLCRKVHIKLSKPDLTESLNDFDRLKAAVVKECKLDNVSMGLKCLRELPIVLREGNWELTVTLICIDEKTEIINLEPGISTVPAYGLAVDIGTTTVVVSLLDLEKGKVLDRAGTYNKQSAYGSDVISRIIFSDENPDGLKLLQNAVIETINELIEELALKRDINISQINAMVCAGNTVMTHFLMKVPATYLRLEPYIPAATKFPPVKAKELGININPETPIVTLPSIASYVGGDISAGVLATMFTHSDELTLFIDIGTNGELVLGNKDWLVTCSCSAGPAFEGSGISCGMRAMDGAIDWIEIDETNLEVNCRTIGDVRPLGICGSGLIYSLSEMMEAGIIDRAGKIFAGNDSPRIRQGEAGPEYVLVFSDQSGGGHDIVITEGDIKNLLRAKAAMFAGIRTMLQQLQLDVHNIERVYIAGGFGNYINITDAINIGLLPDLPYEKFEYVGNSCIQGTMIVLLCQEALKEAERIADGMTYLELSVGNTFMEEFISALFIPHTDMSLFPSAMKKEKE